MSKGIIINILIAEEAPTNLALKWGFWNPLFLFKKKFEQMNIQFNFFKNFNNKVFECDYLFLNSRNFPKQNTDFIDLEYLKKIYKINENIIWFDMRDSAGTTQFEVMPYVKKYVKKQIYKDYELYKKNLYGGRFYTDYYHKNHDIVDDIDYQSYLLNDIYKKKIILGWNIGISKFFNYSKYNRIHYYFENLMSFVNKENINKLLNFQNVDHINKSFDIFFHMNLKFKRKTVAFQRNEIFKILSKTYANKISNQRINKKSFINKLVKSKLNICAYGWGEVCYRDYESVYCGTPFLTADMSRIETWPNIYYDQDTYLSYSLDFSDFEDKVEYLLKDKDKRLKLVKNAQSALNDSITNCEDYFTNKILEIVDLK